MLAARQDSVTASTGFALVEDIEDVVHALASGSVLGTAFAGFSAATDVAGMVVDPLANLASWGASWLLEHVQPLREALDALAGDTDQIQAYAQTWHNISAALATSTDPIATAPAGWTGAAATTYLARAGDNSHAMYGLATGATGMSTVVELAGTLVAAVRSIVRDLIADFVATLAVRLAQWALEAGLSFGVATPLIAFQVTALVARYANRIKHFLKRLITHLRRLARESDTLRQLIDELRRLFRRGTPLPNGGPVPVYRNGMLIPPPITSGPTMPTKPMLYEYTFETNPHLSTFNWDFRPLDEIEQDARRLGTSTEYRVLRPRRWLTVRRLTEAEREEHRIFVGRDGLLYRTDGTLFDSDAGRHRRAIFIMDNYGNTYASTFERRGEFHHSTLANGRPIAGGGELIVEQGKLREIGDKIGHYEVTLEMNTRVAETLRSQGAEMTGVQITDRWERLAQLQEIADPPRRQW